MADFGYIGRLADVISGGDPAVMGKIDRLISRPSEYFAENSPRYEERGIDAEDEDEDTLYLIGLVDELADGGYIAEVDYKCECDDFLWALEQLKTYPLISRIAGGLSLDESDDVEAWGREICLAAGKNAVLGWIDIDSDSYLMFILPVDKIDSARELASSFGHILRDFRKE